MSEALLGRLATGIGQGRLFTRLEWARAQFIDKLGIDPYPGTVNLVLENAADLKKWAEVRAAPGIVMESPEADWCNGRCYRVRIEGKITGAIVLPEVPGYPASKLEMIAPVGVRDILGIADGDPVTIELQDL